MFCLLNNLVTTQDHGWKDCYAGKYTKDNTLNHNNTDIKSKWNDIKHSAINPAIVVTELPITDENVCEIACAIARCLSPS